MPIRTLRPTAVLALSIAVILPGALRRGAAQEEPPAGPAGVMDSHDCAMCHSNAPDASAMRDEAGREIAPYDLWRSTMMANSARDPLWRAALSAEIAALPSQRAVIEETCLACHAPMAQRIGLEDHGTGTLAHVLDCDSELGALARDGVSCTICHGIRPEGLGTDASFNAGFELDDRRRLFGPHREPFAMPMRNLTTFTPTHGEHVSSSALCGSCHTLETETFDAAGNRVGTRFLEQSPFLEWRNSDYRDDGPSAGSAAASCQDCHMPTRDVDAHAIRTRIARNPGGRDFPPTAPRAPFGRHLFVGGNTLVLSILRDHGEELNALASPAAFQATLDATRRQLEQRSAAVAIEDVRGEGGALSFDVRVENLAGHKLPTGHPTRRAWLRVVVRDARGEALFASGRTDARGRIVGADGEPLPAELAGGPTTPHRDVVRNADEVATFQATMADDEGRATYTLLRGAAWLVDDRLLPAGWSARHPDAERTAPVGLDGDADFVAGSDRVHYALELAGSPGASITVELLYQPLGARWAAELLAWDTPEVATFRRLYESADPGPEVLGGARWPD